jgi:nucleolysin TIA-1/TIAR
MADSGSSASAMPPPSASAGAPGYDGGGNQGQQQHMPPPPLAPVIIPQASMPPPSASAGAPGYDGGNQGQQHMPPPLAPVIIPQNTNPIPTAISSPMGANPMSPTSGGGPGYVPRRAAPEPNKRALYVGGLDPRVTEDVLRQIFETTGHVQSVKIIPDKNSANVSCPRPWLLTRVFTRARRTPSQGCLRFCPTLEPLSRARLFTESIKSLIRFSSTKRALIMALLNSTTLEPPNAPCRPWTVVACTTTYVHGPSEPADRQRWSTQEIRVNWAYQSNTTAKEDTSNHFHIFVGDLSNEVNDEVLLQAFSTFGVVSEARVMWDMKTGRSRGYGFVAFRDRTDAERALSSMDGEWLGSRAIRCNWANQKGQPSISQQQAMASMGMTPTTPFGHHHFPTHGVQSFDMIVQQTPQWQTTCYVGNLTPYTAQSDLVPLFQNFGYVTETRFQSDRGFAFIKMDTHENAAMAICQLNGYNVNGRPLKCSVSRCPQSPPSITHVWF